MALPDEDDSAGKMRMRVLSCNKDAARYFFNCMNSDEMGGRVARGYWRKRGLSDTTIKQFGLGYAPESYHIYNHLKKLSYTDEELINSGMFRRSNNNNDVYTIFAKRAMIPIFDVRGNVIAFSGRQLFDNQRGKYVNSFESIIYKKSKTVFLLNFAKKSKNKKYLLCEGNLDAISLHQAGFDTAVAGCGTALTQEQVRILSDYAEEIVLCYDSDGPGKAATAKALKLFESSPAKVSVIDMQDAKDPDEFLQKFGKEKFSMLLTGSSNAIEYKLSQARAKHDIATADGRVAYLKEATNILAGPISAVERDVYASRLAEETDVEKKAVLSQISSAVGTRVRYEKKERERRLLEGGMSARVNLSPAQDARKTLGVAFAEQQLIGAVLQRPEYMDILESVLTPEDFISEDMAKTYEKMLEFNGEHIDLALLGDELPDETINLLSKILAQNYDVAISEKDLDLYIDRIKSSTKQSDSAAEKSASELADYLSKLKEKKS